MSASGGNKAIIAAFLANMGIAAGEVHRMGALGIRVDARRGHPLASPTAATSSCSVRRTPVKQQADSEHPFGYGRERYVYAFLVSIILFSVGGLFSIYEGVEKIMHPHELENVWIPLSVLGIAIVLESFSLRTAIKESNHIRRQGPVVGVVRAARQGSRAARRAARGRRRTDRPRLRAVRRRTHRHHPQPASSTPSARS